MKEEDLEYIKEYIHMITKQTKGSIVNKGVDFDKDDRPRRI